MSDQLHKAYMLHSRPYRDTSLLIDYLTEDQGLISCVARGAKRPKSTLRHNLSLFLPALISWSGKGELKTLKTAEAIQSVPIITGSDLFKCFYFNELLIKLLHRYDPCPDIFSLYEQVLNSPLQETDLRYFEFNLLAALGYGVSFHYEAHSGDVIIPENHYYFDPNVGFVNVATLKLTISEKLVFKGEVLIALAQHAYQVEGALKAAKQISRLAFRPLLGDKGLKSRDLFKAVSASS